MKKIIQILLICLMIATIIVIATKGFKVGLQYSENTQISININKEFKENDVKQIAKGVFEKQSVMVQTVELYKDTVKITVKDASEEQIANLNTKMNEKYEMQNEVSDISIKKIANTRLRDLIKPYILPIGISSVAILLYVLIRFKKLNVLSVLFNTIIYIVTPQALLISAYALIRIPINAITPVISMGLYIISVLAIMYKLIKDNEEIEEKNKSKK